MQGRILAIGDVHGCNRMLRELLELIKLDPLADTIVFVGDYLDRGPDIRGSIDTLLELKEICPRVICLKGNHEAMFLDYYLEGRDEELFMHNSGWTTLDAYGMTFTDGREGQGFPENHLRFLSDLSLFHETEEYLFVHAGIRPRIPFVEQSPEDLLWIRHEFINSDWDFGRTVVFGHTALPDPLIEKNKIGIDTGAVYGGRLTCIELPSLRIYQV